MLILSTKKLFLQRERRDPLLKREKSKHVHLKTVRIPTFEKHMEERGDSSMKQTQKMCQIVLRHVLFMKAKHSTLETKTHRERTARPVVDHDNLSHEQTMLNEVNMGLPNSRITTFCCEACAEYQRSRIDGGKLRTTQIDTIFSKMCDKIKHTTHSVQNQRT